MRQGRWTCLLLAAALAGGSPLFAAGERGFVEGAFFSELAGDEDSVVEVNIPGNLLKLGCQFDPDLCDAIDGVHSIRAVILELEGENAEPRARSAEEEIKRIKRRLGGQGWESLVRIRERGADMHILLLFDDGAIDGLALMGVDGRDVLFVNIAGTVDLAAIQRLGERYDIPGLDEIGDLDGLSGSETKGKKR
jgi:hypothetical protein